MLELGRFFIIACIGWIFVGTPVLADEGFSQATTPVPSILNNVWDATVQVQSISKHTAAHSKSQGTGLVISYDSNSQTAIVVTNGHVAACPIPTKCGYEVIFYSGTKAEKKFFKITLIKDFPKNDLAFLRIKMDEFIPKVALLSDNPLNNGTNEVAAIGYPDLMARDKKAWEGSVPTDYKKSIKRYSVGDIIGSRPLKSSDYPYAFETHVSAEFSYVLIHSADTLEGNSGGPLVETQTGYVIGINTGILNAPKNFKHCDSEGNVTNCSYYTVPSDLVIKKFKELQI